MLIGFALKDKNAKDVVAKVAPDGVDLRAPMAKKAGASDLRISTGFAAFLTQNDAYLKTHLEPAPTKNAHIHTRRSYEKAIGRSPVIKILKKYKVWPHYFLQLNSIPIIRQE